MSVWSRLGLDDLRVERRDVLRALVLVACCVLCALITVDHARVPSEALVAGDVAPRTIKAPYRFHYQDFSDRDRRQAEARAAVPDVYVHRGELADELRARVPVAFAAGRERLVAAPGDPSSRGAAAAAVREALGVHLPDDALGPLLDAGLGTEAENLTSELVARGMRGYILARRDALPVGGARITVLSFEDGELVERSVGDFTLFHSPEQARDQVSMALVQSGLAGAPWAESAAVVARALLRPNLEPDPLETEKRRVAAASAVPMSKVTVKRGTTIFRQGDVLGDNQILQYRALQHARGEHGVAAQVAAVALFLFLMISALVHFGATFLPRFSTRLRDVGAAAALLVLTAFLARATVLSGDGIAEVVGGQATPASVWFVVPVGGGAMLVRLLIGVSWAIPWTAAAAVVCGLTMELDALYVVYFLISGVAAAGAVEHTRERMAIVRSGLFAALVNAVAVLLIHFLHLYLSDPEASLGASMRPLWSVAFGAGGGLASALLVLGLVPIFETVGFVTEFRLMELANLNHPLLRQLMLRAPGSYHHSVIVGSLAEAACERIGANALQARVAAYFHDVGKSLKPQYFVENQRGVNRHDRLDPHTSAQILIQHVVEGGRLAREHRLPKPIIDNIYMHHGTGIIQYFYARALEQAGDPSAVREADFRYPGPRPRTREAGVIMLADKVEAATRTIRDPDEAKIRAMTDRILQSVLADAQLEECPLTVAEIAAICDTFVKVLTAIHHHRVEYPSTAGIARGEPLRAPPVRPEAVITLDTSLETPARPAVSAELPSEAPEPDAFSLEETTDPDTDYESVDHLPRGR